MKKNLVGPSLVAGVIAVMALSIWGPEAFSKYRDKSVLNEIHVQEADDGGEGYRYALSRGEKMYILAEALNSRILPESEQYAVIHEDGGAGAGYQETVGSYAFIVNHRGPSDREITEAQLYETCNRQIEMLKQLQILPDSLRTVEEASYDAVLYSAIDVLEPRNNVAVWNVSLSNIQRNPERGNRLIDAYIDADDGKIYELYVRTERTWEEINPDEIIKAWSGYLEIDTPAAYEADNPLLETTPYFRKYTVPGMGEGSTVVTIGFYEGINELFIKITK